MPVSPCDFGMPFMPVSSSQEAVASMNVIRSDRVIASVPFSSNAIDMSSKLKVFWGNTDSKCPTLDEIL